MEGNPRTANKRRRPSGGPTDMDGSQNSSLPQQNVPQSSENQNAKLPCDPIWLVQQDPMVHHYTIRELLITEQKNRAPRKQQSRESELGQAFLWRDAPELETVLLKYTADFYACIGEKRGTLLETIMSELHQAAETHEYSFNLGGEKGLKARVRSFYNTLWQSVKKKLIKEAEQEKGNSTCRQAVINVLTNLLSRASTSLEKIASKYPNRLDFTAHVIESILPLIPEMKDALLSSVKANQSEGKSSSKKNMEEHVSFSEEERVAVKKKARVVVPLDMMHKLTVPPQSHKLWKDGDKSKIQVPEDSEDTKWTQFPSESSLTNFVWKRYTRSYPGQCMLSWVPSYDKTSALQQIETFATLVRVRLASGLVRSALGVCHQRLLRLYRDLESSLHYERNDHLMIWRHHTAACWCLYAHIWLEFEDLLAVPGTAALMKAAVSILSAATNCSVVGNHAWVTVALARLVGRSSPNTAMDILWDGVDRAKSLPVKPRVLLTEFNASSVSSLNIASRWKISALRKEKLSAKHLQDTMQQVLDLPAYLPQSAYLIVDEESRNVVSKELSIWGKLRVAGQPAKAKPAGSLKISLGTVLPHFQLDRAAISSHNGPKYEYRERPFLPFVKPEEVAPPPTVATGVRRKSTAGTSTKPQTSVGALGVPASAPVGALGAPAAAQAPGVPAPAGALAGPAAALAVVGAAPKLFPMLMPGIGMLTQPMKAFGNGLLNGALSSVVQKPVAPPTSTNAETATPTLEPDTTCSPSSSGTPANPIMEVEQICPGCNSLFSAETMPAHRRVCTPMQNKAGFATSQQNAVAKF